MNNQKKLTIAGIATIALMGGGLFAQHTLAASSTTVPGLVSEIATKFGLKEADVQAVFDQHKTEVQADRATQEKTRLDAAVTAGTLTSAQETLILDEQKTIQTKMDAIRSSNQDKTSERTAMDALRTEVKAWATANNIDLKWVMPGHGGPGGGRGDHMGKMME